MTLKHDFDPFLAIFRLFPQRTLKIVVKNRAAIRIFEGGGGTFGEDIYPLLLVTRQEKVDTKIYFSPHERK